MEWIKKSLMEMREIKVGMTRADLFKVFGVESGRSTNVKDTYVYHDSSYIKVNVEFASVKAGRDAEESEDDLIENISRPYIEFGVIDHTYWLDKILIRLRRNQMTLNVIRDSLNGTASNIYAKNVNLLDTDSKIQILHSTLKCNEQGSYFQWGFKSQTFSGAVV